jgi:hypothetical protein
LDEDIAQTTPDPAPGISFLGTSTPSQSGKKQKKKKTGSGLRYDSDGDEEPSRNVYNLISYKPDNSMLVPTLN